MSDDNVIKCTITYHTPIRNDDWWSVCAHEIVQKYTCTETKTSCKSNPAKYTSCAVPLRQSRGARSKLGAEKQKERFQPDSRGNSCPSSRTHYF